MLKYGNKVKIMGILLKLWEYCYNYGNNVKIMRIMFIIMRVIIKSFLICFSNQTMHGLLALG